MASAVEAFEAVERDANPSDKQQARHHHDDRSTR